MERVYVIPLRKAFRASRPRRSEKAMKVIREFLERHTKPSVLKIDPSINEEIWKHGIEKPPRKIKVAVTIKDEKGSRIVEAVLFGAEKKAVKPVKKEEKKPAQEQTTANPEEATENKEDDKTETQEPEKSEDRPETQEDNEPEEQESPKSEN